MTVKCRKLIDTYSYIVHRSIFSYKSAIRAPLQGTCELRMVLAIDRMKGPEWRVLKSDIRNPNLLWLNKLHQVTTSVIQRLCAKSIPPYHSLPINSSIVTCWNNPTLTKASMSLRTYHHWVHVTCDGNIFKAIAVDKATVSWTWELTTSTIRGQLGNNWVIVYVLNRNNTG